MSNWTRPLVLFFFFKGLPNITAILLLYALWPLGGTAGSRFLKCLYQRDLWVDRSTQGHAFLYTILNDPRSWNSTSNYSKASDRDIQFNNNPSKAGFWFFKK